MLDEVIEVLSNKYNVDYNDDVNLDVEVFENEKFVDIKGYNGEYQISNYGRVWSTKNQIFLSESISSKYGHLQISLCSNGIGKTYKVHNLVLINFNRSPKENEECRHLDGNPKNNHISNLCWGTRKENMEDRGLHGNTAKGEKNGKAKLTEKDVRDIRHLYSSGCYSHKDLAEIFGVSTMPIFQILNNITWKCVI